MHAFSFWWPWKSAEHVRVPGSGSFPIATFGASISIMLAGNTDDAIRLLARWLLGRKKKKITIYLFSQSSVNKKRAMSMRKWTLRLDEDQFNQIKIELASSASWTRQQGCSKWLANKFKVHFCWQTLKEDDTEWEANQVIGAKVVIAESLSLSIVCQFVRCLEALPSVLAWSQRFMVLCCCCCLPFMYISSSIDRGSSNKNRKKQITF